MTSSEDEKQPGVANYKDKLSLGEWAKDSMYADLIKWIKKFCLFQGLIINKYLELKNSEKIAVSFVNIPNVKSCNKLCLKMIEPTVTLEEFIKSNVMNNVNMALLPLIKKSIISDDLSYEDYMHFMIKRERCEILFSREDIKASESFEQAIKEALESMKPFMSLQDVFDKYGYFFPLNIVLGESLKSILPNSSNSSSEKIDLEINLFESAKPYLDKLDITYLLTKKGNIIEINDLYDWIQDMNNDLEIVEYDNIISLYDILEAEQKKKIDIVLSTNDKFKIITSGAVGLKDLDINNIEHFQRINVKPSMENRNYEVFGSIISKDKKVNLKSEFFIKFGLYDTNGFSVMIKTFNKNNSSINITECYIIWVIIGKPSELSVFSPKNRELQVSCIRKSITLQPDNSYYRIKTSHQLSQGDIVSVNIYCSTTNYELINVKLIGWSKNCINFQMFKSIYDEDTDSLTNIEEDIVIDMCVCILSSEYESLKIDDEEKKCHFCRLNLIGYTLSEDIFNEETSIDNYPIFNKL
ncbi:hypothetical protein GLOIN_2v1883822 [Rhizophagus clarus]|uniref:Uncharacterized protein n=1 Tax=Rhizophagus clarus TaxID=94130 RepID=A0A8H3R1C5_9GLOM|nr:hypothetical protein GLOIN_2v1883822 [Rhizophagus clarus]